MSTNMEGDGSSSAKLQSMEARIGVLLSTRQYDHPLVKLHDRAVYMAEEACGARIKIHQHPLWKKSPENRQLLASTWFDRLRRLFAATGHEGHAVIE